MQYVIAGICVTLCIVVIFFGLRVLKESRNMVPQQPVEEEDDDELQPFRP